MERQQGCEMLVMDEEDWMYMFGNYNAVWFVFYMYYNVGSFKKDLLNKEKGW